MDGKNQDYWGKFDADDICDNVKPLLSKALAACEDVIEKMMGVDREELADTPILELREKVWDIIVAVRKYEERRAAEIRGSRFEEEGK